MMDKSIIVGIGNNREIGLKNQLLWHLPADLKCLKKSHYGMSYHNGKKDL